MPYGCNTGVVRSACRSLATSAHLQSAIILLRTHTTIWIHAQHKQGWCGVQSLRSATGVVVQGLADASRRTTPPQHTFAVRQTCHTKTLLASTSFKCPLFVLLFVLLCLSCCIAFVHTLRLSGRFDIIAQGYGRKLREAGEPSAIKSQCPLSTSL